MRCAIWRSKLEIRVQVAQSDGERVSGCAVLVRDRHARLGVIHGRQIAERNVNVLALRTAVFEERLGDGFREFLLLLGRLSGPPVICT